MEPEGSLPLSQELATLPLAEPNQSSPQSNQNSWKSTLTNFLSSTPRSSKCSLSLRFSHQSPVHTFPLLILATCSPSLILLDLIIQIILGKEYRLLSSSLCSLLHSPLTLSLLRTAWNKHYDVMMSVMANVDTKFNEDRSDNS